MGYEKNYGSMSSSEVTQMTMSKVYSWMFLALLVSAGTAVYTVSSQVLLSMIFGSGIGMWALMIGEVGLVWYLSARIHSLSFSTAALLFGIYSILNGITLSVVLLAYATSTVYTAFFSTALTFGAMSLFGYTTKKDLTSFGSFFMMGIVGLIIATLVNMFLHNSVMDMIITYIGLFLFIGLTAYDTQKIKVLVQHQESLGIDHRNLGILGALSLYLDFVNLFLYIIRLLGRRE